MVYVRRPGSRRFRVLHKNRRPVSRIGRGVRIRHRQRFSILNLFLNPTAFIAYLIFFIIFIGIFIAALISISINPLDEVPFKNKSLKVTKLKKILDRIFKKKINSFKTKIKKNNKHNNKQNTNNNPVDNEHTVNIVVKTDNHNDNEHPLSYFQYKNLKAHERVINPLLPPERSMDISYGIPINIPTRGESGSFQQIGALYKEVIKDEDMQIGNNTDSVVLALYGKPTYPRSNKWTYYTSSDSNHQVKMPLSHKGRKCDSQHGCEEIMNNDLITIPSYNGVFKAVIYDYDAPKYIPCV